ncbi:DUF6113 family protein [Streptomyces sp. NPDC087539]|uniref:DUF6113 family protein n=1 Tax=Streptomyces sp. NPDC087539 TaxID=3365798 RepID=UPI0037F2BABA
MSGGKQRAPRPPAPSGGGAATGLAAPLNPGRIAAYVGLAVLGALVGIAGALVQAAWFPAGLLLALVAAGGLFHGGRLVFDTQLGTLAPAAGWLISIVVLLGGRPEGDYVFGDELGLTLFMLGGMAVAVICATMSRAPRPGADGGRSGK